MKTYQEVKFFNQTLTDEANGMTICILSAGGLITNDPKEAIRTVLSKPYLPGWNWKKTWILNHKDTIAIVKKHDGPFERNQVLSTAVFNFDEIIELLNEQ